MLVCVTHNDHTVASIKKIDRQEILPTELYYEKKILFRTEPIQHLEAIGLIIAIIGNLKECGIF